MSNNIYIAVMDYRDGNIKMYTVSDSILEGWEDARTEGVEYWLCHNTDYTVDECYFMFSKEPINIIQK